MKISKHSPPQPRKKGLFLSSMVAQLTVVPPSAHPNCTIVFPPSEAGKRFRLCCMCQKTVKLLGKAQKLAPKHDILQRKYPQVPFLLSPF